MVGLNTLVLIIYLALTFLIAGWGFKVTKSSEDYWVAGRSLGVIVSVGTYFATLVSSWSVLGATGYFYNMGWAGYWQFGGTILTSVFAAVWFGAKLRSTGYVSLPDILAARYYSNTVRVLTGALILVACIMFLTVQALGAGVILNQITGISQNVGIVIGVVIFLIFTVTGGMHSVAWTDFAQAIIILAGVLGAVIIGLNKIGGFGAMHLELAAKHPVWLDPYAGGKMGLLMIINWFVIWGVGNLGTPQFMSRFLACKDIKVVRLSQGITAFCFAAFYFLIGIMGGLAKIYYPGIKDSSMVGPTFVTGMLPPVIAAIIMSALMAAAMSTASSVLLVAATTFARDFYQCAFKKEVSDKQLVFMSRLITVIISIAALFFALMKISTIFWLQPNMVATMGASIGTALVAGFAWKRANKEGAIASISAGIIVTTLWFALKLQGTTGLHPVIPGTLAAIIFMIVVSLLTQKPPEEVINEFFPEKV
ncbi:MAG: solute:Na+ symporter, family [Thermosediminibacterales bacterium]|nr:solute:Na+ symporter, family [Thermosediminibacterales bacterium]MDK2836372.1 solute:Na+ symporter, family [Thermosediminibacterales bacterium]